MECAYDECCPVLSQCVHLLPARSRLVLSESLAHQSPHSPFRRAPSSVMSRTRSGSVSTVPFDQETQELLDTARTDIQRLREKEERKVGWDTVCTKSQSEELSIVPWKVIYTEKQNSC